MLNKVRKGTRGVPYKYEMSFMRRLVAEYEAGDMSLRQVGRKYGIDSRDISRWRKKFNSEIVVPDQIPTAADMTAEEQKELEGLKKKLAVIQDQLDYEKLRNFALETMIDLAKEKLGVDVRKNFGAKQPKQ